MSQTPFQLSAAAPQAAHRAAPPRLAGHPSLPIDELRTLARAELQTLLEAMFRNGPWGPTGGDGDGGASGTQPRRPLAPEGMLHPEQARLLQGFAREVERSFRPAARVTGDCAPPVPVETFEEQQALGQLALRTARRVGAPLERVYARLKHAARALGAEVSPQALEPLSLCECWLAALLAAGVGYADRMAAHRLFDRFVLQRLGPLYRDALTLLDRHGWSAPEYPIVLHADGRTRECLERCASDGSAFGALAGGVLAALRDPRPPAARALAERTVLVGSLVNQILDDAQFPAPCATGLESLRLPVLWAALADSGFFADAAHPLRRRLSQLAAQAGWVRLGGTHALRQLDAAVADLRAGVAVAPTTLLERLGRLPPLGMPVIARFVDAQRRDAGKRRDAWVDQCKRMGAQEIEVLALGVRVPPAAHALLHGGLASLLAARLMRHGVVHPRWPAAMDRVRQVLASLEGPAPTAGQRGELVAALRADLADAGIAPGEVVAMLSALERAWAGLDSPRPLAPVAAPSPQRPPMPPDPLLAGVLQPRTWFRVFGADGRKTLWLRLESVDADRHEACFVNLDASRQYRVGLAALDRDLRAGRTDPVEPSPAVHEALLALRLRRD